MVSGSPSYLLNPPPTHPRINDGILSNAYIELPCHIKNISLNMQLEEERS